MRRYARRKYRKRRFGGSRRAKFVRRVARRTLRNMAETKFFIQAVGATFNSTTAPSRTFVAALAQGVTGRTRIGSQIRLKRIGFHLRFTFAFNVLTSVNIRVAIIYPRKRQSLTTVTSVITSAVPGITNSFPPESVIVLYDRYIRLEFEPAAGAGTTETKTLKFAKTVRNIMNWDSAGTIGQDYILYITNDAPALDASVRVDGDMRISFKDM